MRIVCAYTTVITFLLHALTIYLLLILITLPAIHRPNQVMYIWTDNFMNICHSTIKGAHTLHHDDLTTCKCQISDEFMETQSHDPNIYDLPQLQHTLHAVLLNENKSNNSSEAQIHESVVNLSNRQLTEPEFSILQRGMKFCPTRVNLILVNSMKTFINFTSG